MRKPQLCLIFQKAGKKGIEQKKMSAHRELSGFSTSAATNAAYAKIKDAYKVDKELFYQNPAAWWELSHRRLVDDFVEMKHSKERLQARYDRLVMAYDDLYKRTHAVAEGQGEQQSILLYGTQQGGGSTTWPSCDDAQFADSFLNDSY